MFLSAGRILSGLSTLKSVVSQILPPRAVESVSFAASCLSLWAWYTEEHNTWLCRITMPFWKRQEIAVLCGEAVQLNSRCLSTEQG